MRFSLQQLRPFFKQVDAILPKISILCFGFSLASLLGTPLAGLGTKWGWYNFIKGLSYFRDWAYLANGVFLLSLGTLLWGYFRSVKKGRILAVLGLAFSFVISANFFSLLLPAMRLPHIHDISTDTKNPPAFNAILYRRSEAPNSPLYGFGVKDLAEQQQKAYPTLQPLHLKAPVSKVFNYCLMTVEKKKWDLAGASAPDGIIEATAETFWFGFKDDVVIRVKPEGDGCRVDMRSESRVGLGDVGTNAKRIQEFLKEIQAAFSPS